MRLLSPRSVLRGLSERIGLGVLFAGASVLHGEPSRIERISDSVLLARDDSGRWGGSASLHITHQLRPEYQAKKILDLGGVSEDFWGRVKSVRVSALLMVRDYSGRQGGVTNGLDEAFEVVVNGKAHVHRTDCGATPFPEGGGAAPEWCDFDFPKEGFVRGRNEIILRKAPGAKHDDYLYLCIDPSERRGNSAVTFDGKKWFEDKLTVPGGAGEYMVRLFLLTGGAGAAVVWTPGKEGAVEDPGGIILYCGARRGSPSAGGLLLPAGERARIEWAPEAFSRFGALKAAARVSGGKARIAWLKADDAEAEPAQGTGTVLRELAAGRAWTPAGMAITATAGPVTIERVTIEGAPSFHPPRREIDMCPAIAAPAGRTAARKASCRIAGRRIEMENATLRCRFEAGERLRLASLYNEPAAAEMIRDPLNVALFLVETDGRRYAGSRDFRCRTITPTEGGFDAELALEEPPLTARLGARIAEEGLRLTLAVAPAQKEARFKLAFPHLEGLAISEQSADDHYFFPSGGGIFADAPAIIRRGYGDHEALYQIMDVYSPSRGAGLYCRIDDPAGWHKTLALRKHAPGRTETDQQKLSLRTAEEYQWTNALGAVEGVGVAVEYLRRTRAPGKEFAAAPAVLAAHAGDWRDAMRVYADWAHKVWAFRPRPSRLRSVHNMIAAGWGKSPLFRDGAYRSDFMKPGTDCIELMSWWEWSPLGPWSTPLDRLETVLKPEAIKRWEAYFVKDPVTGQKMWNNQPGDYDGYNERFGGLPALRKAIGTYRESGALVTLYTDPFRLDDASKAGRAHGKEWGVVGPDGKHTTAYEVWNPCHDCPEVREWVAGAMGRVMRETGADGIRLDEYGHRGWACFSDLHEHTFSERGVSQWQKAVAEATRMVRAAMDEVRPGLVLTTEHPGYDYLMQHIDGCITYDLTVMAAPLRPLECNLQRFFFPECKAYELDHRGADPKSRKKFWNAVGSFGRYYPEDMHAILRENEDVYQDGKAEPLVPSLARGLYVNRFSGAGKTLHHVYNATGHTFDGPAVEIDAGSDERVVELFGEEECTLESVEGGRQAVCLYLERDAVGCVALMTRRIDASVQGERVLVWNVAPLEPGDRFVVADGRGTELASTRADAGTNAITVPATAPPACVKLLRGGQLVDIAPLAARRPPPGLPIP